MYFTIDGVHNMSCSFAVKRDVNRIMIHLCGYEAQHHDYKSSINVTKAQHHDYKISINITDGLMTAMTAMIVMTAMTATKTQH